MHVFMFSAGTAAAEFSINTAVNVSAESVNGSVRVTWNIIPPVCVASVTVEFRTQRQLVVPTHTTTLDPSQTEFIQTGLQCGTNYYISVKVTGEYSVDQRPTKSSRPMQMLVSGGKFSYCKCAWGINLMVTHYCTDIPTPVRVRAEVAAENTIIRVSWEWQILNVSICVDLIRVHYLQPWRGSRAVGNSTATTSAILPNLHVIQSTCTIWVDPSGGRISEESSSVMVYLPARGM